eukprot:gb/GEZJ01003770.1/.p3 GENE.gb/GEZJ01003770.1/~~gb/GEZJ01003770.1/.p3  ORF type:complete len:112 (+),score=7.12 gb/GEZJ01003770.1/:1557-1892(+)
MNSPLQLVTRYGSVQCSESFIFIFFCSNVFNTKPSSERFTLRTPVFRLCDSTAAFRFLLEAVATSRCMRSIAFRHRSNSRNCLIFALVMAQFPTLLCVQCAPRMGRPASAR